jgi:hypothetical protein
MTSTTITLESAVSRLVNSSDVLKTKYESLRREWQPDEPPPTIVFSSLGRCLCRNVSTFNDVELSSIWQGIEELILNGDTVVSTGVTTGLLEVVLAEASAGRLSMRQFVPFIGPRSIAYCRAWDTFTGYKTEGIWNS